jgi:preprotein translocase subunit SecY
MKQFLATLQNIWRIDELRQRILFTLLMLAVYRFGSYIVLPGIDSTELQRMFEAGQGSGILGFLNTFVGGAFARGSILALGIMPYISASIIVQLLGVALPSIQKLQREGESGQRKVNQYTRYLTVVLTAGQSIGYLVNLQSQYPTAVNPDASSLFWITAVFLLTAGTVFLVWLGERITEHGIGNGVSLLIAIGIVAELPGALIFEGQQKVMMVFFLELLALGIVTMGVIMLTTGVRKIPVNYARRMMGNRMMGGMTNQVRQYIPLKLNASGVMPIIFAQSIMFLPATVYTFFPDSNFWLEAGTSFSDYTSIPYNVVFALLIILFSYFYTAIVVNPNDMADQLKRNGGFIPGVKPGRKTSEYIDDVLTRITLPGSLMLAFVAILPAIVTRFGASSQFAQFFGGTSLLIMIGVVLDTLQQVESYLLMRHYDGLMKTSRVRSRNQPAVGAAL